MSSNLPRSRADRRRIIKQAAKNIQYQVTGFDKSAVRPAPRKMTFFLNEAPR